VWLYPYHSSPRVVHLCYDTVGNGLVYILTPG
jgi:hypothetical protein